VSTYRRLLRYARPYVWPRGVAAVAFMVGYSGLEGLLPLVVRYTVKHVFSEQRSDALTLVVVAVVVIGVLRGALSYGSGYLTDWIGQRVITDLRNELTEHMQTLDLSFFNRQRAGQIVSRVTADVRLVREAVTDAVKSVFQDFTSLVVLCVAAVYLDAVLAFIGLLLVPVIVLVTRYLSVRMRLTTKQHQEATGRLNAMLHETVQGNRVVKVFGRERFEGDRLRKQDELLFRLFMRASRIRSFVDRVGLPGLHGGLVRRLSVIAWTRKSEIAGSREALSSR
jgi:subfamily B ATP-binding cassette protein MsbA